MKRNHPPSSSDLVDVAVIGAGIAGLAATKALVAAGLRVVVLEARERAGGRLLSVRADGTGLDLGATWFWAGEVHVQRLIEELDVSVFPQHIAGDAVYHDPAGSQRMNGNPIDVPSGRFANGADSLTDAVAAALPREVVQLGCPVDAVDSSEDHLTVSTSSGLLSCRHAVVSVPPALAVERIAFRPPLDDRIAGLAATTPVWMGGTTKVVVQYAEPFWRSQGLSGSGISHFGPMRELHDMSGPDGSPAAIFGFIPATSGNEPTATSAQVVTQLQEMFGPPAADPVAVHMMDWRKEAWTSPEGVERLNSYQTFGHPRYGEPALGGRLHWASTETATESPGHIEGAISAAYRAANAIISSLVSENSNQERAQT